MYTAVLPCSITVFIINSLSQFRIHKNYGLLSIRYTGNGHRKLNPAELSTLKVNRADWIRTHPRPFTRALLETFHYEVRMNMGGF